MTVYELEKLLENHRQDDLVQFFDEDCMVPLKVYEVWDDGDELCISLVED